MPTLSVPQPPPRAVVDPSSRFRIVHVLHPTWYYHPAGYWWVKAEARMFNSYERAELPLPQHGCWEIVMHDELWFEDHSTEKLGVSYGGPIWTHAELAERFGHKTIAGMRAGESVEWVYVHARLAGSFARLVLAERDGVQS